MSEGMLAGWSYDSEEHGSFFVYQACPECGGFCQKPKEVLVNGLGEVKALTPCKRCKKEVALVAEYI